MRFALPPSHNFIYACTLFALFHLVQFCSVITATLHFAIHMYCMNIFFTFIVHDFNQCHGFTVHACGIYWKRIFVMMPNLSLLVAPWLSLWQTSVPPVKTKWASWQISVFISRLHLATGFIRCISNKVIGHTSPKKDRQITSCHKYGPYFRRLCLFMVCICSHCTGVWFPW